MESNNLHYIRFLSLRAKKVRKQLYDCIHEAHRRSLWKQLGYTSMQVFLRKFLELDELEVRKILLQLGAVYTRQNMKDDNPEIQRRIHRLIGWRQMKSGQLQFPPYFILTNKSLMEIARRQIDSIEALAKVQGFGMTRALKYGKEIFTVLEGDRQTVMGEAFARSTLPSSGAPNLDGSGLAL